MEKCKSWVHRHRGFAAVKLNCLLMISILHISMERISFVTGKTKLQSSIILWNFFVIFWPGDLINCALCIHIHQQPQNTAWGFASSPFFFPKLSINWKFHIFYGWISWWMSGLRTRIIACSFNEMGVLWMFGLFGHCNNVDTAESVILNH